MSIISPDCRRVTGVACLVAVASSCHSAGKQSTPAETTSGTTHGSVSVSTTATGPSSDARDASSSGSPSGTGEEGSETSSGGAASWCHIADYPPQPPQKVMLIVDSSASMVEPVKVGPGAPVVPWEEMSFVVQNAIGSCLGDDVMARAQFQLRLMPGPVGDDVCGRSDALDIHEWVSADTLLARLAEVVPQGGRAMRRTLEDLPDDADLIVLLSHGAPGCGDDINPEMLDVQVAQTVLDQGLSVTIGHVALVPGITPTTADFEPDGVDPKGELSWLGMQIEKDCSYPLPLFEGLSACPNLIECIYGNRADPCYWELTGPAYDLDPNAAAKGDLDEVLIRVGDELIPRVESCDQGLGWWLSEELTYRPYEKWPIWWCSEALCERRWKEGLRIQHSCNVDAPG